MDQVPLTPPSRPRLRRAAAGVSFLVLLWATTAAWAQEHEERGGDGWNSPAALELIRRARERRAAAHADTTLRDYQALAQGHVYFYLDRNDSDERTLIRVDQVAVEVAWAAPDRTKQRIVGMRDVSQLPNRQTYHLDHLTVVQDEFPDIMRMGDGDEVRDVPHPAAPGSDSIYDFRLADSLTLRIAGVDEPIRVYEIETRPRRFDRPAFVGSIFIDRATAAIVRLVFTFTPASYVDRRLDYIRVSLENGLWNGRHWLPYEQRVEIRRQIPELNFLAGAVIQGVMRIGDYVFDQDLPNSFFDGPPVVALPRTLRESYPFQTGLLDDIEAYGLATPPSLDVLRRQAAELVGNRYLSGLPRLRLHLPNASAALRFNRAESVYLGAGVSYAAGANARLELGAGFASGTGNAAADVALRFDAAGSRITIRGYGNALRDLGVRPGAPGALNTLMAAATGSDYLDPYRASGASADLERDLAPVWRAGLRLTAERHRNARLTATSTLLDGESGFRPVLAIQEGTLVEGAMRFQRVDGDARGWTGRLDAGLGALDGRAYFRSTAELEAGRRSAAHDTHLLVRLSAGTAAGEVPEQRLFLIGGRNTLPGYAYRAFAGHHFALAELEASRDLFSPWLRLRATAAAGWTRLDEPAPADWNVRATDGVRAAAGIGFGAFYDIIRVDLVRGLQSGGRWQGILSVNPRLWDIL